MEKYQKQFLKERKAKNRNFRVICCVKPSNLWQIPCSRRYNVKDCHLSSFLLTFSSFTSVMVFKRRGAYSKKSSCEGGKIENDRPKKKVQCQEARNWSVPKLLQLLFLYAYRLARDDKIILKKYWNSLKKIPHLERASFSGSRLSGDSRRLKKAIFFKNTCLTCQLWKRKLTKKKLRMRKNLMRHEDEINTLGCDHSVKYTFMFVAS